MPRSLAVFAVLVASCGLPPLEQDVAMGRRTADEMSAQIGLYEDEALSDYVESVAHRVVDQVDAPLFRYEFAVLDQPEPNAFAAPGGFVFVSRGLIAVARSEDELAGVLGHEAVHVEHRHTMRQMTSRRGVLGNVLAIPGRIVGVVSEDVGDVLAGPFEAFSTMRQASYGRSQESEADEAGALLAARAGYDPLALGAILDRMDLVDKTATGERRRPSFFDTHPATPDRIDALERHVRSLPRAARPAKALDDDAFLRSLDGLLWGPNPAQGEFRDERFLHLDLDFAIDFPSGWNTMNTARCAGAVAPDESAILVVGVFDDDAGDVERLAAERRRDLQREAGLSPARDEPFDMGGKKARLLVYTEGSGGRAVHAFWVWVAHAGRVLGLVGMVPESGVERMRQAVESLRPLSPDERDSFVVHRIRIVEARDGETITQLGARANNVLRADLTAVINGVDRDARFDGGRLVKIVERSPYRGAR